LTLLLIISWIASLLVAIGMWRLRKKDVSGWYLQIGGSTLFMIYAGFSGVFWGIAPLNIYLIYQSIRAIMEWKNGK